MKNSLKRLYFASSLIILLSADINAMESNVFEMDSDDIIKLKKFAVQAYNDAHFDHNNIALSTATGRLGPISINGIEWAREPFGISEQSISGAINYSPDCAEFVVSFHGSIWMDDWVTDFKLNLREAKDLHPKISGKVHKGFSDIVINCYEEIYIKIINILWEKNKEIKDIEKIYFTGHSLGGALATLAGITVAFDEERYADLKNKIKIITFSTPRAVIGNKDFVESAYEILSKDNIVTLNTKIDLFTDVPQKLIPYLSTVVSLSGLDLSQYEPFGHNIEIGPLEKALSYYFSPVPSINLEAIREHPSRPIVQFSVTTLIKYAYEGVTPLGLLWRLIRSLSAPVVEMLHAEPSDEGIRMMWQYAQYNYNCDFDNPGEFSLFCSVKRNMFLNYISNKLQ